MAHKTKFKLMRNSATGQLEWTEAAPGRLQVWFGWLIMAVSTILFLLLVAYFGYWMFLARPSFDPSSLPGGNSAGMHDAIQRISPH
jgi:hypothetical protein